MSGSVVKAPVVMRDGSMGVRGFRAFCAECGFLSKVHLRYQDAHRHCSYHSCKERS